MIELYREADCPFSAAIEARLEELVIAHKVITVEQHNVQSLPASVSEHLALPVLKDDEKLISGVEPIKAHLRTLEEFVALWRKFQSDACYCDEDE